MTKTLLQQHQDRILRKAEVLNRLGISKTTLDYWQNPKSARYRKDFPKKVKLGKRSVGWLESEINQFITALANA